MSKKNRKQNKKQSAKNSKATRATSGEVKPRKGQLGEIMGFAPTAVIRRLGVEGVTKSHAIAIVKKQGVKIDDHSLDVQLGLGRTKARPAAPLTDEQVAKLVACAADPGPSTANGEANSVKPKTKTKSKGKAKAKGTQDAKAKTPRKSKAKAKAEPAGKAEDPELDPPRVKTATEELAEQSEA